MKLRLFAKLPQINILLVLILLPSLCSANGPYSGDVNQDALVNRLKADPQLLQSTKQNLEQNFPQVIQAVKILAFSPSDKKEPYPSKVPASFGKPRGIGTRNLRPRTNISPNNPEDDTDTISITPGREFTPRAVWNAWIDGYYFDVADRRYELNFNGQEGLIVIGADKLLQTNFAFGFLLSAQYDHTTNFGGNWTTNSRQVAIGPYFAYQISPKWAVNTSVAYGYIENDLDIGRLNGRYIAQSGSIEIDIAGQYNYKMANIRYKPSIFYSYYHNSPYDLTGAVFGSNFNIFIPSADFSTGIANFTVELNRDFKRENKVFEPFAEAGVTYAFLRPNNGQILTGNLILQTTSAWSGLVRLGARILIYSSLFIEANAAYLSIGQGSLNIWEGRLYLSYSF